MATTAFDDKPELEDAKPQPTGKLSRRDLEVQELERIFKLNDKTNRDRLAEQVSGKVNIEGDITVETEGDAQTTIQRVGSETRLRPVSTQQDNSAQEQNRQQLKRQDDRPDQNEEENPDQEEDKDELDNQEENPEDEKEGEEKGENERETPEGEGEAGPEGETGAEGAGEGAGEMAGEEAAGELGAEAAGVGAAEGGAVAAGAAAGTEAGAAAAGGAVAASAPIWGTAALIILGIILVLGLVFFIFVAIVAKCNENSFSGGATRFASWVGIIPGNICAQLTFDKTLPTAKPSPLFTTMIDLPYDYWTSNNFGSSIGDYPRVTQSVYNLLQTVFTNARAAGLNIKVTSALRQSPQFQFSCHFLGEAVDVTVNPASNANVAQLVQIARAAGFGFVLNEYSTPSEQANGPHVHMQLTANSCQGRQSEIPDPQEYYVP